MTANRHKRPIELQDQPEHRSIPIDRIEFRDDSDDNTVTLSGYASTFESYSMYGGPEAGGWIEQIGRSAFDKTLREKPDLHLLINHAGMPLARTKSGTLSLSVDDHGLRVDAKLDRRDPEVQALVVKMERGDMDEMSFAFRVKAQEWEATGDFPDDDMALRTITEVSLHKGDVSVVNWGANPTTSASVRSVEEALKVIAECDSDMLVEARCEDDVLRKAQEKLGNIGILGGEAGDGFASRLATSLATAAPTLPNAVEAREESDEGIVNEHSGDIREELKRAIDGMSEDDAKSLAELIQRAFDELFESLSAIFPETVGFIPESGLPDISEAIGGLFRDLFPEDRDIAELPTGTPLDGTLAEIVSEGIAETLSAKDVDKEHAPEPGMAPNDLRMLFDVWDER